jgi:hypothetical protein
MKRNVTVDMSQRISSRHHTRYAERDFELKIESGTAVANLGVTTEPLRIGRRQATDEELNEARTLARQWIIAFARTV